VQNSHILIAATWLHEGKPKPIYDYQSFVETIGDVDVRYGLDIYRDDDKETLNYLNDEGQTQIFKYGNNYRNVKQALTDIRKNESQYIEEIKEQSSNRTKLDMDLNS